MVSNCRGIHPWDRFDFWNKSADLYNSSSLPMVPQANGRELILERGKLFPSQTLVPCQFLSCGHCACFLLLPTAGTYFPCVAIPCSRRALSVTSDYGIGEGFSHCTMARKVPLVQLWYLQAIRSSPVCV